MLVDKTGRYEAVNLRNTELEDILLLIVAESLGERQMLKRLTDCTTGECTTGEDDVTWDLAVVIM